jgi:polysaccharide export outer membrane protein
MTTCAIAEDQIMEKLASFRLLGLLIAVSAASASLPARAADSFDWLASTPAVTESAPPSKPAAPTAAESVAEPAVAAPKTAGYRIGPEDILEISVWKEEGLSKEVLVRPDGGISFPLAGEVQAAGRTAEEIGAEIASRLKRAINDPVVSVSVLKVTGNKIYIIGRVARPGEYSAGRYVDVLQALAMAGGLTPYAAEDDIKVLRKLNGVDQTFAFEYSDVRRGRKLEQNITLRGGDVVVVP